PVTEVVYDVDLVRAQLAIAEGAALPAAQRTLAPRGWALEARIAAEDPARDFAPAAGRIARFEFPRVVGMRLDSGFGAGSEVPIFYDSLLAKLIVHAPTRELACARLAAALERATIDGIPTNLGLLRALAREPDFLAGRLSTAYLGDHPALAQPRGDDDDLRLAVAALAFDPNGFRIGGVGLALRLLDAAGAERALVVSRSGGDDGTLELRGALDEQLAVRFGADGHLSIDLEAAADGRRLAGRVQIRGTEIEVERDGRFARLRFARPPAPRSDAGSAAAAGGREIVAPMAGKIVALAVGAGDVLAAGELVAVLEAMKMEHRIEANGGGRVARVAVAPGSIVAGGATLVELEEPSP
ncbi:MAG: biotin/lipoyl-containing protein, partial [Vulcanimicrobiaceae bacterium]